MNHVYARSRPQASIFMPTQQRFLTGQADGETQASQTLSPAQLRHGGALDAGGAAGWGQDIKLQQQSALSQIKQTVYAGSMKGWARDSIPKLNSN